MCHLHRKNAEKNERRNPRMNLKKREVYQEPREKREKEVRRK